MRTRKVAARIASGLYKTVVQSRGALYDAGALNVVKIPNITVVSVGNLAVGGTGKTPVVELLARRFREKGAKVAVVSRGYKGSLSRQGAVAGRGNGPLLSAAEVGDEAYMLAKQLDEVSIYVGADRAAQVEKAKRQGATIAILDDGFQHRRLHRDLDILLAAPSHLLSGAPLLPCGVLREPPEAAIRADLVGGLDRMWRGASRQPDFTFEMITSHLENDRGHCLPVETLSGKSVVLLAAIANPVRFETTAVSVGAIVVGTLFFKDHHRFTQAQLERAAKMLDEKRADMLVSTEKDWARLSSSDKTILRRGVALCVKAKLRKGDGKIDKIIEKILHP